MLPPQVREIAKTEWVPKYENHTKKWIERCSTYKYKCGKCSAHNAFQLSQKSRYRVNCFQCGDVAHINRYE